MTLGDGVVLHTIGDDEATGPGLRIHGYAGKPFVLKDAQGNQLYPLAS
ncbi:MAG: hypothetical protein H0T78_09545 [Longispora sp.]|nr:hypothetical protein [Longispora sp. (in: high G+C Gram-positive bacteria)]